MDTYKEDIRGIFLSDVREKKSSGRGAYHRRRGSKTKHVSLPSDHMTEAEWKRRNGKVTTYQLGAPMTWEEFRKMPQDLREQYVRLLHKRYGVSRAVLAEAFGVSDSGLRRFLIDCDLSDIFRSGSKMKQADKEAFLAFWTGDTAPAEETAGDPADDAGESPQQSFAMSSFALRFTGPYSADHLANSPATYGPRGNDGLHRGRVPAGGEQRKRGGAVMREQLIAYFGDQEIWVDAHDEETAQELVDWIDSYTYIYLAASTEATQMRMAFGSTLPSPIAAEGGMSTRMATA